MPFPLSSLFAEVKFFRFCPKPLDYIVHDFDQILSAPISNVTIFSAKLAFTHVHVHVPVLYRYIVCELHDIVCTTDVHERC